MRPFGLVLLLETSHDPCFFVVTQPPCLLGSVRQKSEYHESEYDGRYSFDEEQPLPAGESGYSTHSQENAGDRPADNSANCRCRHETGNRAAARIRRKPIGMVKDHARK